MLNSNTKIDPDLVVGATGNPESGAGKSIKVSVSGTTRSGYPKYFTADLNDTDADGAGHSAPSNPGGTLTATMTTLLPVEAGYTAGELKPNESVTITCNVIVQ